MSDETSMSSNLTFRQSRPEDIAALDQLYPAAFPDEDLLPLVREFLAMETGVLSLVAIADSVLAGHVIFTACSIDGEAKVALLGPLCAAPARQRQGVGTALVREALQRLRRDGTLHVLVLGDPAYYSRFGFSADHGVKTPFPIPEKWLGAWRCLTLKDGLKSPVGELVVPAPWRKPALWAE